MSVEQSSSGIGCCRVFYVPDSREHPHNCLVLWLCEDVVAFPNENASWSVIFAFFVLLSFFFFKVR